MTVNIQEEKKEKRKKWHVVSVLEKTLLDEVTL